jgi:hypothetical protein
VLREQIWSIEPKLGKYWSFCKKDYNHIGA